jgi:hypothetical protein
MTKASRADVVRRFTTMMDESRLSTRRGLCGRVGLLMGAAVAALGASADDLAAK